MSNQADYAITIDRALRWGPEDLQRTLLAGAPIDETALASVDQFVLVLEDHGVIPRGAALEHRQAIDSLMTTQGETASRAALLRFAQWAHGALGEGYSNFAAEAARIHYQSQSASSVEMNVAARALLQNPLSPTESELALARFLAENDVINLPYAS